MCQEIGGYYSILAKNLQLQIGHSIHVVCIVLLAVYFVDAPFTFKMNYQYTLQYCLFYFTLRDFLMIWKVLYQNDYYYLILPN